MAIKFAYRILRTTRISYRSTEFATKAEVMMVVFGANEDEALLKAEASSKRLEDSNEFYTFKILTIVEVLDKS